MYFYYLGAGRAHFVPFGLVIFSLIGAAHEKYKRTIVKGRRLTWFCCYSAGVELNKSFARRLCKQCVTV
jgi:hypothetical protein